MLYASLHGYPCTLAGRRRASYESKDGDESLQFTHKSLMNLQHKASACGSNSKIKLPYTLLPFTLPSVCHYQPRKRRGIHSLVVVSLAGMLPRACFSPQGPDYGSLCPYTFEDVAPRLIKKKALDMYSPFYTSTWLSPNSSCFSNCSNSHGLRDATDNCSCPQK